jgi:hypothetical protein
MKLIKLTKGKFAKVDDRDFEWLSQFKWCLSRYAIRSVTTHSSPKQKQIRMHNDIMNPPEGMIVDHINCDPLDNRRINLRICTPDQNQINKGIPRNNKVGIKGVCKESMAKRRNKPWRAFIRGKLIGYFKTPQEAGIAYNKQARVLFGEFANLNKIGGVSNS